VILRDRLLAGLTLALSGLTSPALNAEEPDLQLSPLFSDHAVIQRGMPVRFWGTADAGEQVRVRFAGKEVTASAEKNGRWLAEFPALEAGGPYELHAESDGESVTSRGILIGDVWICSGQSNMGWTLEDSDGGAEAIRKASNPNLRILDMDRRTSRVPLEDANTDGWLTDAPENVGDFSGVGYYFGLILQRETGVPIGLIESTWGGTPAEAWTPQGTLEAGSGWSGELIASLDEFDLPDEEVGRRVAHFEAIHRDYLQNALNQDIGMRDGWRLRDFDDSGWTPIEVPGFWEPTLGSVDGLVWYRYSFELTEEEAKSGIGFNLGAINEYDDTYVNGRRVGGYRYKDKPLSTQEREFSVGADRLHTGKNVIAVRIVDTRTAGGFGSTPETLTMTTSSGTRSLAGTWLAKVSYDSKKQDGGFPLEGDRMVPAARQQYRPSALYNGMVHPLTGMNAKGVIWYQGEANIRKAGEYRELFPAMIEGWRDAFQAEGLPFLFVQLPAYRPRSESPEESIWAELRESQEVALGLDRTAMAVTVDLGQADNIHPRDKLPVAQRLADLALAEVYDQKVPHPYSPAVSGISSDGGKVILTFDHADGLRTTDDRSPQSFSLAGSNGEFHWADAELHNNRIVLHSDAVPNPVRVRYAWAWNPDVNTVNAGGKPLAPFRASLIDGDWRIGKAEDE